MLVDQIDLDVAKMRSLTQIILPHEAIEPDWRGGAGIHLVIGNLSHLIELIADLGKNTCGVFNAGAFRHVDNHLKLGLVVKGQHLQHHRLVDG